MGSKGYNAETLLGPIHHNLLLHKEWQRQSNMQSWSASTSSSPSRLMALVVRSWAAPLECRLPRSGTLQKRWKPGKDASAAVVCIQCLKLLKNNVSAYTTRFVADAASDAQPGDYVIRWFSISFDLHLHLHADQDLFIQIDQHLQVHMDVLQALWSIIFYRYTDQT